MSEEVVINRCSKCKSTMVYLRLKTKERVCRRCGFIEDISEDEK